MSSPANKVARLIAAAASTNDTLAFAGPANVQMINGYNAKASVVYLKLYDKLTQPSSSDTPKLTIALAASAPFNFTWPYGIAFPIGLGFRLTTGSADNDTGVLVANDIVGLNIIFR